ncbi:MAG: tRNA preQ1(34) S-adenosylmethionine ribosyltransferase-isomerase QueA [Acidimicrobiales bacterium]
METAAFDYRLPEDAIAQVPVEPRDAARLLVDRGPGETPEHRRVADLPALLRAGDLLVVNDTRVRPARLHLRKASGGRVEVLLLEPLESLESNGCAAWTALVRPSRRVPPGTPLEGPHGLLVRIWHDLGEGRRTLVVEAGDPGPVAEVPLPPYIRRPLADPERYQTVYGRRAESAAAPTAGLHLTGDLLARCERLGIGVASLELSVGLDTFRPITEERVEDHPIHAEAYDVPPGTWEAAARTRQAGGRVVAVGTTVVRALETVAVTDQLTGRTQLFIRPGFEFQVVDRLLTNFHVPMTTLLALVDAFVGPRWRDLYTCALAEGYRFLSFGDACLLDRR